MSLRRLHSILAQDARTPSLLALSSAFEGRLGEKLEALSLAVMLRSLLGFRGWVEARPTRDCSPAIASVEAQFGERPLIDLENYSFSYSVPGVDHDSRHSHVQGVAMLRDVQHRGRSVSRLVVSFNSQPGLVLATRTLAPGASSIPGAGDHAYEASGHVNLVDAPLPRRFRHPGGVQAHGDLVAVAMEDAADGGTAAVAFIQVDGLTPRYVGTLELDAKYAAGRSDARWAASVGFVKLHTGGFLVAVAGRDNGRRGVWFVETDAHAITPATPWRFTDFWTPDRLPGGACDAAHGKVSNDCWAGAGGGLSLLTTPTGEILLCAMTGTAGPGKDNESLQVFSLARSPRGRIVLRGVLHRKRTLRLAVATPSFRWSASAHVFPEGRLCLLSTKRGTGLRDTAAGIGRVSGTCVHEL